MKAKATTYYLIFVLFKVFIIFIVGAVENETEVSNEEMESYLQQQDTPEGKFAEMEEDDNDDEEDENSPLDSLSSKTPSSDEIDKDFLETDTPNKLIFNSNFNNSFPVFSKQNFSSYRFKSNLNTSSLDKSSSMYSTMFLPPLFAAAPFAYYPPIIPVFPPAAAPAAATPLTGNFVPPLFSAPATSAVPTQPYYWGQVYDPKFYYILGEEPKRPRRKKKFKNKLMKKLFEKKNKDEVILVPFGNSMIFISQN